MKHMHKIKLNYILNIFYKDINLKKKWLNVTVLEKNFAVSVNLVNQFINL